MEDLKYSNKMGKKAFQEAVLRRKINIRTTLSMGFCKFQDKLNPKKKLVIIGCGRSGTSFSNVILERLGKKVGHEKLGVNGISSWCLVPDTGRRVWGPSWKEIKTLNIETIHQVRHPLLVIASSRDTFADRSWNFISRFIPTGDQDSKLLKAMKYWYYWNNLSEKKAKFSYRVEDFGNKVEEIFELMGWDIPEGKDEIISSVSKKTNTRNHKSLTWKDLENEDMELTKKIKGLSKKYGYLEAL